MTRNDTKVYFSKIMVIYPHYTYTSSIKFPGLLISSSGRVALQLEIRQATDSFMEYVELPDGRKIDVSELHDAVSEPQYSGAGPIPEPVLLMAAADLEDGDLVASVAERFNISKQTVQNIKRGKLKKLQARIRDIKTTMRFLDTSGPTEASIRRFTERVLAGEGAAERAIFDKEGWEGVSRLRKSRKPDSASSTE